jgi:thiol-disulfide isomerase/thioredoxin
MHHQAREMTKPLIVLTLVLAAAATVNGGPPPKDPLAPPKVDTIDTQQLAGLLKPDHKAPVLLNFWATWCPPCVKEMPDLADFYRAHAADGLRFVSVSVDHPDTRADRVEPFVRKHDLPFAVHVLTERSPENAGKALDIEWTGAVPATFLFDKNGRLLGSWFEETTREELEKTLKSAAR